MPITSNISEFDKMLTDFASDLKRVSEKGLTDKAFMECLKIGADRLQYSLFSNYKRYDPTGADAGKMKIRIGVYATKKQIREKAYYIIGPDYKTSDGWQAWHLLNYGFVHDTGQVLGKSGKFSTKKHASVLTAVAGKHFLEQTMAQTGNEALEAVE